MCSTTTKYPTGAAILLMAAATLVIAAAIIPIEKASAQMSSTNNTTGTAGANIQDRQPMVGPNLMIMGSSGANISGSVPIFPTISKAIASQVHTSLINATINAEKRIGNSNVHAVAAHLGIENGFLVYTVWIVDSNNNNFYRVIVDAGNGKVISSQQISSREMVHAGDMMMMKPGIGMMIPPPRPSGIIGYPPC